MTGKGNKTKESVTIDDKVYRKCSECKEMILSTSFGKNKSLKDGLHSRCLVCQKTRYQNMSQEKKDKNKRKKKEYYAKNSERIKNKNKEWAINNRERYNAYFRNRKATNVQYKLTCALRNNVYTSIKRRNTVKSTSTFDLTGCTIEVLIDHLEKQFTDGMSWKNQGKGGWEIDHIRPCSSFDLTNPIEQRKCFHYTNLQPLWAEDNSIKGDKWIGHTVELSDRIIWYEEGYRYVLFKQKPI